jgi:hypothetical protein
MVVSRDSEMQRRGNLGLRRAVVACLLILSAGRVAAQGAADDRPLSQDMRPEVSPAASCSLQSLGQSAVLNVVGPQTLRLADGRFVRLSDILVPTSAFSLTGFNPSAAAIDWLNKTVVGRKVEVKAGLVQRDRYGVISGHVFLADETGTWVQGKLVELGLAQTFVPPETGNCTAPLLTYEQAARAKGRGHWGLAVLAVHQATDARKLGNLVQTYQIVEGRIVSVSERSGRRSLHFGSDPERDFTAVLETGAKKALGAQVDVGAKIRVRGWLDRRRGLIITVSTAQQIELVEPATAAAPVKQTP